MYRHIFGKLVTMSLATLLVIPACGDKPTPLAKTKIEGDACNGDECIGNLLCIDNVCSKICHNDSECAKYQKCNAKQVCRDVPSPLCMADEDCKTPGQCEVQSGAVCEGGHCIYEAIEAGVLCNDDKLCTINDKCDGNKNCVGDPMPCATPPDPKCIDDNTFRVYAAEGSCEVIDGAGVCNYNYTDSPCTDCPATCGHFCDEVDCTPLNQPGICQEQVCDYRSTNNPPCSPKNKVDGSACKYINDNNKTVDGHCSNGTCVECVLDTDCANTSEYPDCQNVQCVDNRCQRSANNTKACGGKDTCVNSIQYSEFGNCSMDGTYCAAEKQSCGNYQCDKEGHTCLTKCLGDNDCKSGFYCTNDFKCELKAENGSACNINFNGKDCIAGHCDTLNNNEENKAVCCAAGQCCLNSDNDCPAGQKCQTSTHQCISGDENSACAEFSDCKDGLYCHDLTKVCTKQLENGRTICGADNECISGHCDLSKTGPETGRCCSGGECCDNNEDCPTNFVCKNSTCTQDDTGNPCKDDNDCNTLTSYCAPNKAGELVCTSKKNNGKSCEEDRECSDGHCVRSKEDDEKGVCCNSSCDKFGYSCMSTVEEFADNDGKCLLKQGRECKKDSECQSNHCIDGYCCGANYALCRTPGSCDNNKAAKYSCGVPGSEGTCTQTTVGCGLYQCNTVDNTGCWEKCDGRSGQCADNAFCNAQGKCELKKGQGSACGSVYNGVSADSSCEAGLSCADGVCCDKGCNGTCESCNQPNHIGQCLPVYDQTDETCALDKGCGVGFSCICGSSGTNPGCHRDVGSTCTSGNDCSTNICNSDGFCADGYGNSCKNGIGQCRKIGEMCSSNGECLNKQCVDGVCCQSSSCSDACSSCSVPGHAGECSPVINTVDPDTCDAQKGNCLSGNCVCDHQGNCKSTHGSMLTDDNSSWNHPSDCIYSNNGWGCSGSECTTQCYDYRIGIGRGCSINSDNYSNNDYYCNPNNCLTSNNNVSCRSFCYQKEDGTAVTSIDSKGYNNYYYSYSTYSTNFTTLVKIIQTDSYNGNQLCQSGVCHDRCCKREFSDGGKDYCYLDKEGKYYLVVHFCDQNGDQHTQTGLADAVACEGMPLQIKLQ